MPLGSSLHSQNTIDAREMGLRMLLRNAVSEISVVRLAIDWAAFSAFPPRIAPQKMVTITHEPIINPVHGCICLIEKHAKA